MTVLYFAYGSNLKRARMVERVPGAVPAGIAWLADHAFACSKLGRDGSGKANLHAAEGVRVWGALYRLRVPDLALLDRYEGGYERVQVEVRLPSDEALAALTYCSTRLTDDPTPLPWYRALILEGAREHGLPAGWIDRLAEALGGGSGQGEVQRIRDAGGGRAGQQQGRGIVER